MRRDLVTGSSEVGDRGNTKIGNVSEAKRGSIRLFQIRRLQCINRWDIVCILLPHRLETMFDTSNSQFCKCLSETRGIVLFSFL